MCPSVCLPLVLASSEDVYYVSLWLKYLIIIASVQLARWEDLMTSNLGDHESLTNPVHPWLYRWPVK